MKNWTTKQKCKLLYWAAAVVFLLIAWMLMNVDGIFIRDTWGQDFYKLTEDTETQRVFVRREDGIEQVYKMEGRFPGDNPVIVTYEKDGAPEETWTLTETESSKKNWTGLTIVNYNVSSGKNLEFSGTHYQGKNFSFVDWEAVNKLLEENKKDIFSVVGRMNYQEKIQCFLNMAYGESEMQGKYNMEFVLYYILCIACAYALAFHAGDLFELQKAFSWDIKNAADMEPSSWYFFTSYAGAALFGILAVICLLCASGILS